MFDNYEEATIAYQKAIDAAKFTNRYVYKKLAEALQKQQRFEEALTAYEVCAKEYPNNHGLQEEMGNVIFILATI